MKEENIRLNVQNGIGFISINRPQQLNALNISTIKELSENLKKVETDKTIKVAILSGEGNKAFVAGADIKEFANFSKKEGEDLARNGQESLFNLIENFSKPVIAAVNGFALGGGLELAMSCHIRIASQNAKMGLPEVSLGVIPGYGGTQRLAQLVGKGRAMEMIMTAGMIDANTALGYGLVNHVTPIEELMPTCMKIANKIMRNSSVAISAAIKSVNANYTDGVNGFNEEIEEFGNCFGTDDFTEGTNAFLEKRKANFPGL